MLSRHLSIIFLVLFSFSIYSCASFSKKRFRKEIENLKRGEINELNGIYSIIPMSRFYSLEKEKMNIKTSDSLIFANAFDFLIHENHLECTEFHELLNERDKFQIRIKIEDENRLLVNVIKNSSIIKDTLFSGKYRNGMFYLDEKKLDCNGIPYLFGGCRHNKRRIGITKSGNLLINEAVCNEGAILLLFGAGYSYNMTYEYKKNY